MTRVFRDLQKRYGKARWRKLKGIAFVRLVDVSAARSNLIRVIDDSGEDYLYPSRLFLRLQVSSAIREALRSPVAASV